MTAAQDARLAKLAEVHQQLTDAVVALASGDEWQRMLRLAARFHTYSPSNILLIGAQAPHATRVAGYRTWASMGRQVRKGEKGIAILAPCLRRVAADSDAPASAASVDGRAMEVESAARQLAGFRVVHVFDISQTDGDPLPEVEPRLLTGDGPEHLWDELVDLVEADGFTVTRGPCGGANGLTRFDLREVRVRDDVDPAQAVKTLAHEFGHIRADHEHRFLDAYTASIQCRGVAEVEAESIAYIVCATAGLDTADYSVGYVAGWSNGQEAVLRNTAARVIATAAAVATSFTSPVRPADDQASQNLHCPVQGSGHDLRQDALIEVVDEFDRQGRMGRALPPTHAIGSERL